MFCTACKAKGTTCKACTIAEDLRDREIKAGNVDPELAEKIVDAVGGIFGVDTAGNMVETGQFESAVNAVEQLLLEP